MGYVKWILLAVCVARVRGADRPAFVKRPKMIRPNNDRKESHLRRVFLLTVLIFVGALVGTAAETAEEAPRLILTVEAINGTSNGHPVAGDRIMVNIYEHNKLVDALRSTIADDGKAVFENVQSGEHRVAVATVFHRGMSFQGRQIVLKGGQAQATGQVQVFDVSYETGELRITTHQLIIERKEDSLSLTEYIQLVNPLDSAITSNETDSKGNAIVLTVPLPKGYKDFTSSKYFVTEALGFTEEGLYDTMGVPPGEHEIVFSYALDIRSDAVGITKKISLPTANFTLFLQSMGDGVEGLGQADGPFEMMDGSLAEYYMRSDLPEGAEIAFRIVGLSTIPVSGASWIVLAVVFGLITVLTLARPGPRKSPGEDDENNPNVS
jgi:hypothetical protein